MFSRLLMIAVVAAMALLGGCASSSKVVTGTVGTPIDPSEVRVFMQMPDGAEEVAHIEAKSGLSFGGSSENNAAVERLKKEAAELGANGVVLLGTGEGPAPYSISIGGGSFGSHSGGGIGIGLPTRQHNAAGIAIRLPEPQTDD